MVHLSKGAIVGIVIGSVVVVAVVVVGLVFGLKSGNGDDSGDDNHDKMQAKCDSYCSSQNWAPTLESCDYTTGEATCSNDTAGDWKCVQGYWNMHDTNNKVVSGPYMMTPTSDTNTWSLTLLDPTKAYTMAIGNSPTLYLNNYQSKILNGTLYSYDSETDEQVEVADLANTDLTPMYAEILKCLADNTCLACGLQNSQYNPVSLSINTDDFNGSLKFDYFGGFSEAATGKLWNFYDAWNNFESGPYKIDYVGYQSYTLTYVGDNSSDGYRLLNYDDNGEQIPIPFKIRTQGYAAFGDANDTRFGVYSDDGTLCKALGGVFALLNGNNNNMLQFWNNNGFDFINRWRLWREDVEVAESTGPRVTLTCS